MSIPQRYVARFSREDGSMTAFGLFIFVAAICIGGLALDVANAITVRTHLQVAADSAAHAALYTRETKTAGESRAIAVQIAQATLPKERFGATIEEDDILFGYWDATDASFEVDDTSRDAVLVRTQRVAERSNAVTTFFMRMLGINHLDVVTESVYETYRPRCLREGLVGEELVEVQSNNTYVNGYCIHSNDHVEFNNGNFIEEGVVVSMPYITDIGLPSSGYEQNEGLADSLLSSSYPLRILKRLDDIIAGFDDPFSQYFRVDYFALNPLQATQYLDGTIQIASTPLDAKVTLNETVWVPGTVHERTCIGNGKGANTTLTIPSGTTLRNGAIKTNCYVSLGSNVTLENVIILSTNDRVDAVSGASNVTLGKDDNCADGGGVQIITKGGFQFPAQLNGFGLQVIAMKKIDFEANANGMQGVSMVSGDTVDSNSNMNMGFCDGAGLENNYDVAYFRLAY